MPIMMRGPIQGCIEKMGLRGANCDFSNCGERGAMV